MGADTDTPALLAQLACDVARIAAGVEAGVLELRALRAAVERNPAPALVAELAEFFGAAPFSAAGVLMAAEESASLADALAAAIDTNGTPEACARRLGRLLPALGLEAAGDRRGARLWRVRE